MNLNRLLAENNLTKYRLSKLTNIPYSTINDIFNYELIYQNNKNYHLHFEDNTLN